MWQPRARQLAAVKMALFALCFAPFAHLVWGVAFDALGANPVEAVTHSTGWWTLFLLCATLGVTPLRRATGANWLLKLRRMLGLYAFFYATLHFLTYIWLDQWFDVFAIAKDVLKRPYITVGFTAFSLLIPLAATSTDAMQRRLGRNWQRVHRFIYLIAIFGVLHFWWLVKRDITEPALFALILSGLLGVRLYWRVRRRAGIARPAVATSGG
jgi:sulfoxide reductase heme-binding subunit YedZ